MVLELCYKTINNMLIRQANELHQNERLLEKKASLNKPINH
jgi:hypothetical protein